MTWANYHAESEKYANQAEEAKRKSDSGQAVELYRLAAEQETLALRHIDPSKKRTIGIITVSAAALWFKAGDFVRAQKVAEDGLATANLPPFADRELRELLQTIQDHVSDRGRATMGTANDDLKTAEVVDIVSLLLTVATKANDLVQGSGTSVFLKDEESEKYVLVESTVLTGAMGNSYIDVRPLGERYDKGDFKNIGLTAFAILSKKPLRIDNPLNDEKLSTYGREDAEKAAPPTLRHAHFEIPRDKLGAFLAIPLRTSEGEGQVFGVVRVVRSKTESVFTENDQERLEKYLEGESLKIENAFSWIALMDIGRVAFDLKELCSRVVQGLKKIIGGAGCSVFLLDEEKSAQGKSHYTCAATTGLIDPQTYKEVYPSDATYEVDDAAEPSQPSRQLTEWVIRNKQNLLIDSTSDIVNVVPGLERPSGHGKFYELPFRERTGGPVLYSPLLSKDMEQVTGVLRVSKPKGEPPFTEVQKRLFLSFALQLSRAVNTGRYLAILGKVSTSTVLTESEMFGMVVDQVPKLVGATGCSLFIVKNNKLRLAASSSWLYEEYKQDFSTYSPYRIGEGYTGWVAAYKEPLRFNDKKDLQAARYDGRRPKWSGRKECEVGREYETCDRFLAVPVFLDTSEGKDLHEREVIGVLRVPKMRWQDPFTELDERLLSLLAARLSPAIQRINLIESTKNKRLTEIKETFSPFLAHECQSLGSISYREKIKGFFSDAQEKTYDDLGLLVLSSIKDVWSSCKIKGESSELPFGDFKLFEDYLLKKEIPNYREHFIHSYQVFLSGCYVLDQLYKYKDCRNRLIRAIGWEKGTRHEDEYKRKVDIAWLIASTSHDIAYPIQLLRESLDNLIQRLTKTSSSVVGPIQIESVLFDRGGSYLDCVDALGEFYKNTVLQAGGQVSPNLRFRAELLHLLREERDHGVLGALILLDRYFSSWDGSFGDAIKAASFAIASHKGMLAHLREVPFELFPISFLLLYCDTIQEWGREARSEAITGGPSECQLEKIQVSYEPPEVKQLKESRDGKVYVNAFLSLQSPSRLNDKKAEIRHVFEYLKSSNPVFCISVNGAIVGHSLK